jgi:hypothetical protein
MKQNTLVGELAHIQAEVKLERFMWSCLSVCLSVCHLVSVSKPLDITFQNSI